MDIVDDLRDLNSMHTPKEFSRIGERAADEIERLRNENTKINGHALKKMDVMLKQADEIERLREENAELKDLIQATVDYTGVSVSSNRYTFHASGRFVSLKEGE